jgi:hypothetical protein
MNVITRDEAILCGSLTYCTGKACKHGHFEPRWVTSYHCIVCAKKNLRENKFQRYQKNPEHFRALGKLDYKKNPDRYKKHAYLRQKRVLLATPKWVTDEMIAPFFIERNRLTAITGIPHDVDHIYPLKSRDGSFSGLHVPANLQVIPSSENRSKQNRYFGARYSRTSK